MKKRDTLIYRIVTVLFSAIILLGVGNYFFNHEMVKGMFEAMEYPTYLIYPLGTVKILGLVAIWFVKSKTLKEWAYAGFVFNLILGISAHLNVGDGQFAGALVALILASTSYAFYRKLSVETAG